MRQKKANPHSIVTFAGLMLLGVVSGGVIWFARIGSLPSDALELPEIEPPPPSATNVLQSTPEQRGTANYPEIFIADAGIKEAIIESQLEEDGWRVSHLENRVGHLEGTGWLGSPGNIVLAGHVELKDGRPGVFARIHELESGDAITVTQNGVSYTYWVTEVKVVQADDLSVVYPTESERVTLITCTGYNFLNNTYEERIVVVAER